MFQKNFLFIAIRYLKSNHVHSSINTMIKISFISICIATCALTLVVSVMQGFEKITYQKMQTIYPDLILDAHGKGFNIKKLQPILQEPTYHITHISEQYLGQALLYNKEYSTTPSVISIRGITPEHETMVTAIADKIIYPKEVIFSKIITKNHIIIGQKLAQSCNLSVGDQATILYTDDEPEQLKINFQQSTMIVSGIFKTGIEDFDTNLVYCSITDFKKLFDTEITQIYAKLDNLKYEETTIAALKKRLNIDVYSWKSLYPTLLATLKLEKYAMIFILMLIVLIASMNLISLTFMYIMQKKKEIALFMCLGMPLYKIKLLFITISLTITFLATVTGLTFAYTIGIFLQNYQCITLPDDIYITTHLPIELDPQIFCAIMTLSLVISIITSIWSTSRLQTKNIVQILKQE